ncbi:MAG TPA: bifunctional diaminohydroxyphosphoribosylaminopyrimidine deaminase/5-amino-6-(5-phosphoribosylamino)uracil reductase RibD [Opitutaceae bacterium]|jgi:diaminohydroxyphosphoribosylaminopyrimidine deaminase/5-amino-6-(5-phosphoribosylamino)uracil reductase
MSAPDDELLMRRALELARMSWGATHPNPMVGAVIAEGGRSVAEGRHERDGGPHAEKAALAALGRRPAPGATLYVTLEPCSTAGRTGACTQAIIDSGIRRVVAGARDPNPEHGGRGFGELRAAGVEVAEGVLGDDCADLNLLYNRWIVRKEPLLAAKIAATLDGRIATRSGESRWISGEAARADVHRWRTLFPAIAVGAGTVLADNPRLTARVEGRAERSPLRFVFDGRLRTVVSGTLPSLYTDGFAKRTVVVTTQHGGIGYARKLRDLGISVWTFESPTITVPLAQFRARCAQEGIVGVLFEGGEQLLSRAVAEKQLDYLLAYTAPVLFADERAKPVLSGIRTDRLAQAVRLSGVRREVHGDDCLVRGTVCYPERIQVDETVFSLG